MNPPKADVSQKSLVSIIEDMIIRESRRFIELRLLRGSLPHDRRGPTHLEMQRVRDTMVRLSIFRSSILGTPYAGIQLATVTNAQKQIPLRDELVLQ